MTGRRNENFEELDRLSSRELHDRAIERARRHLDVRFLWRLLEMVPAAEAATGDVADADADIEHVSNRLARAFGDHQDEQLADSLRPVYIEYLLSAG